MYTAIAILLSALFGFFSGYYFGAPGILLSAIVGGVLGYAGADLDLQR